MAIAGNANGFFSSVCSVYSNAGNGCIHHTPKGVGADFKWHLFERPVAWWSFRRSRHHEAVATGASTT